MKVVIDSNILFSAIIRDSMTRRIIMGYKSKFLLPSFVFEEMIKHKDELYRKSRLSKEEFEETLLMLLHKIKLILPEKLKSYREESITILKDIDVDDHPFIACALAYPGSILWSDDRKLKNQTKVKVMNTHEIIKSLL